MLDICKTKTICESGDEKGQADQQQDQQAGESEAPRLNHGGCGGYQPILKRDGWVITAEFKQVVDENVEKKQTLTAEKVSNRIVII